jgi:UDP-glucose 4-epimerase
LNFFKNCRKISILRKSSEGVVTVKVLITGGAGYLGSIITYAFSDKGHNVVIIDKADITNELDIPGCYFYCGDIADKALLKKVFTEHNDIEIVIHCAELGSVSNSVSNPYEYYSTNVVQTMELFKNLCDLGLKKIIFASSAAVYDNVPGYMVTEHSPIKPRSPFGRSKYITEMILKDFCDAYGLRCITLRYFNPIGADPQGRCGRRFTKGNLLSSLIRVVEGKESCFVMSGDDWGTRDGTCVRDYIHIWDVANANVLAAENFDTAFEKAGDEVNDYLSLNIGSGVDVTVREFINAFENVTGEKIPVKVGPRRKGDISGSYAGIRRAQRTIGWQPTYAVENAIIDYLSWLDNNY